MKYQLQNELRAIMVMALLSLTPPVRAAEIEGFTEPYRNIDVAAADSGIVEEIAIKEGERVTKGQTLGQLNLDVLKATLAIADQSRNAQGKLKSAEAELRLKSERLTKLQLLLERDHASQEEVDRTVVEKAIAEAQLLSVQEDLAIRRLEYDRIEHQIAMRLFKSPIDGVVTKVFKEPGEFVTPSEPVVLNVVQLDPLTCVFSVPGAVAAGLQPEAAVGMQIAESRQAVQGVVDLISPVTDPQSGTVQIKVRLSNPEGKYRSGDKCWLVIGGAAEAPRQAATDKATPPSRAAQAPVIPKRQ